MGAQKPSEAPESTASTRSFASPGRHSANWSRLMVRMRAVTAGASVDAQPVEAVAQAAEGDAEQLRRGRLVEARGLERLLDGLALHLVQEIVQRKPARAQRPVERGGLL